MYNAHEIFVFEFGSNGTSRKSPPLWGCDIRYLMELFPNNPIWDAVGRRQNGNVLRPTETEFRAFREELVRYRNEHGAPPTGSPEELWEPTFGSLVKFFSG